MKIEKYGLTKKNIYNVYLSNGEVLELNGKVITDNELLIKKDIDNELYDKLKRDNTICILVDTSVKYIDRRLRSINELRDYLKNKEEDTIMPFFFDKQDNNKNVNQIEEIKNDPEEEIVDPMDSVIKLDPNYSSIVKEEKGLDLKTAIGEIRNLVSSLEERGFKISLDELDLAGNYQMTINIKNND